MKWPAVNRSGVTGPLQMEGYNKRSAHICQTYYRMGFPCEHPEIEMDVSERMAEDLEPILKMAYHVATTEWEPRLPGAPRQTIEMPDATTVYQEVE